MPCAAHFWTDVEEARQQSSAQPARPPAGTSGCRWGVTPRPSLSRRCPSCRHQGRPAPPPWPLTSGAPRLVIEEGRMPLDTPTTPAAVPVQVPRPPSMPPRPSATLLRRPKLVNHLVPVAARLDWERGPARLLMRRQPHAVPS